MHRNKTLKIKHNWFIALAWFALGIQVSCLLQENQQKTLPMRESQSTIESTQLINKLSMTGTFTPTSLIPSATATYTNIPTWTVSPTITPTPDLFWLYTIEYLTDRSYQIGDFQVEQVYAENSYFTRYLISYTSDGIRIFGFLNVPIRGKAPYPVVIAIHGYIDPKIYQTLDYTTLYADTLARAGFAVFHPNLRGYPPSENGDNLFRVGMAIDVLNLITIVKSHAGQPGILEYVDGNRIGLWGHSMGGGVSIRVMTVNPDVRAVVLYGSMSADDRQNYEAISKWFAGELGNDELAVPQDELLRISPIYYLDQVHAGVSIHHGEVDELVPLKWSIDLCQRLMDMGKLVECYTYPGQPHTFYGDGEQLFNQRVIRFFEKWLVTK
jgi:dipeptidyl aminopeptidase/acylaminoacyl peptidase